MRNEFATFGDPARFAIAVRWAADSEPLAHRPARYGWSMGDLKIIIAGRTITRSRRRSTLQSHASWYLFPIFEWIAHNWVPLLHEEDFAWPEKSSAPALVACRRAMERWIGESDEAGKDIYRNVQAWYRRHALRSSAEGGLSPTSSSAVSLTTSSCRGPPTLRCSRRRAFPTWSSRARRAWPSAMWPARCGRRSRGLLRRTTSRRVPIRKLSKRSRPESSRYAIRRSRRLQ